MRTLTRAFSGLNSLPIDCHDAWYVSDPLLDRSGHGIDLSAGMDVLAACCCRGVGAGSADQAMNIIAVMHAEYVEWVRMPHPIDLESLNGLGGDFNSRDKALRFIDSLAMRRHRLVSADSMERTNQLFNLSMTIPGAVYFFSKGCWNEIRKGRITLGQPTIDV